MSREQIVAVLLGVAATRTYLWARGRRSSPARVVETRRPSLDDLRPGALVEGPDGPWVVISTQHSTGQDGSSVRLDLVRAPIVPGGLQ